MIVILYHQFPGFIADTHIKRVLFIGKIAVGCSSFFTERGGSKEERVKAAQLLSERQILGEKGERPIINIFPEGATTNGKCMLKMKKGAFGSLRAVRPAVLKWKQHFMTKISWTQDVVGFVKHQLLTASTGFTTVEHDILPVFCPNDYFFENHWNQDKEEKWEAFARVIR